MKKPNILIIIIDSLRADHVGCYGYHRNTTPNIDRLAAEGCLFETCITAAPFSPASYASLFSGLYPHQHGVNGDTVRIWPNTFSRLAEKMKANGYSTFAVSNNDFVSAASNAAAGFDVFVDLWRPSSGARIVRRIRRGVNRIIGARLATRLQSNRMQCAAKGDAGETMRLALDCIAKSSSPFFGFVVLMDPHSPYNRRHERFSEPTPTVRRFFRQVNDSKMWAKAMAAHSGLHADDLRTALDCYDSEIWHADDSVGGLVDSLRESGLLDETVVVAAADHGEAFGEHGVWGHGFSLTDALTRVPLVIRCPHYWPAALRSSALVQLHDLHSLCLSLARDGQPQVDVFPACLTRASDAQWTGHDVAFSEFPVQTNTLRFLERLNPNFRAGRWGHGMWAVRSKEWRYIEYGNGDCELYNLCSDPRETASVADVHAGLCMEFHNRLDDHKQGRPSTPHHVEPSPQFEDIILERLRALGYAE